MFEYITLFLQIILITIIIAYAGQVLVSMGLQVYRDRLWNRLTDLESNILEQISNGSITYESAGCLLDYTKKVRANFNSPLQDDPLSELIEILEKPCMTPTDNSIAGRIFTVYLSFLSTKYFITFAAVIMLNRMRNSSKNAGKSIVRTKDAAPASGAACFAQALFAPIPSFSNVPIRD